MAVLGARARREMLPTKPAAKQTRLRMSRGADGPMSHRQSSRTCRDRACREPP